MGSFRAPTEAGPECVTESGSCCPGVAVAIPSTYVCEGSIWYTKGHLATRNGTAKDRILPLGRAGPARVGREVDRKGSYVCGSPKLSGKLSDQQSGISTDSESGSRTTTGMNGRPKPR